ncbi:hypothetical protein WMH38_10485 [Staphylococcus aureus]
MAFLLLHNYTDFIKISNDDLKKEYEKVEKIQESYIKAASNTVVPYKIVNTDSMDWEDLASQIYSHI